MGRSDVAVCRPDGPTRPRQEPGYRLGGVLASRGAGAQGASSKATPSQAGLPRVLNNRSCPAGSR